MATGHFSGKIFPKIVGSDHAGSNDTGLKFVSRPGAEPIECQTRTHTHTHTERERERERENEYYNIDY